MIVENQLIEFKSCSIEYKEELRSKGYNVDSFPIYVKVKDLKEHSSKNVKVICDYCGKEFEVRYGKYTRAMSLTIKKVACKECGKHKIAESNLINYGNSSTNRIKEVKEKKRKTYIERFGAENPMQNEEVKNKLKSTCLGKYGFTSFCFTDMAKQKRKEKMIERYGVDHQSKSKELLEKRKQHMREKYGVEHTLQLEDVREKIAITRYFNKTAKVSVEQLRLAKLFDGEVNYPVKRYNVDILTNDGIVIEYDGSGHDVNVLYGKCTQDDFLKREQRRTDIIISCGYKIVRFIKKNQRKFVSDEEYLIAYGECAKLLNIHNCVGYDFDKCKTIIF